MPGLLLHAAQDSAQTTTPATFSKATNPSRATTDTVLPEPVREQGPWATIAARPGTRASLAGFGAPCASDAECRSNVCMAHHTGTGRCSTGCLGHVCLPGTTCDAACPEGYLCTEISGHDRCVETPPVIDAGTDAGSGAGPSSTSGGCDVAGAPDRNALAWLYGLGLLVALAASRRARARHARRAP